MVFRVCMLYIMLGTMSHFTTNLFVIPVKNTASVFPDDVFDKSFGSETGLPDHPFDTSPVNGSVFSCDPFANSPASGSAFPDDPFHNPMKIGSAFSDGLLDDAGENSSDCDPFGMPSFNLIGNSSNVVGCISVLHHLPDNEVSMCLLLLSAVAVCVMTTVSC